MTTNTTESSLNNAVTLKDQVSRELSYINHEILNENLDPNSLLGVYAGISGRGLLMALNYLSTNDDRYFEKLSSLLDYSINHIESGRKVLPGLASGIAGLGWFVEYLKKKELIEMDDSHLSDWIDDYLVKRLDECLSQNYIDVIHGAISIGHYFLARNNEKAVNKLLNFLVTQQYELDDTVFWARKNALTVDIQIDFGLAHGNAGFLHFFIKCAQQNIARELCLDLIKKSVRFFLNNIQNPEEASSYFPNTLGLNQYLQKETKAVTSRLGWCYGDLCVWNTLLLASDILRDADIKNLAIEGLLRSTERTGESQTRVGEPGFCHGSSGVAYIYHKLWREYGDEKFKNASEFWLRETIAYKEPDGYKYLIGNFETRTFAPSNEFLDGNSGVAVTYLSYLYPDIHDWDSCMLLS